MDGSVRMFWGAAVIKPEDIYYQKINEYMDWQKKLVVNLFYYYK